MSVGSIASLIFSIAGIVGVIRVLVLEISDELLAGIRQDRHTATRDSGII